MSSERCGSGWASASRFPRPKESVVPVLSCLTGPSLPSPSQLLSVPSLHVATTAYGPRRTEARGDAVRQDISLSSSPDAPCHGVPAVDLSCVPQPSWDPFFTGAVLSAVKVQAVVSFKSLRSWHQSALPWYACVFAGHMVLWISKINHPRSPTAFFRTERGSVVRPISTSRD